MCNVDGHKHCKSATTSLHAWTEWHNKLREHPHNKSSSFATFRFQFVTIRHFHKLNVSVLMLGFSPLSPTCFLHNLWHWGSSCCVVVQSSENRVDANFVSLWTIITMCKGAEEKAKAAELEVSGPLFSRGGASTQLNQHPANPTTTSDAGWPVMRLPKSAIIRTEQIILQLLFLWRIFSLSLHNSQVYMFRKWVVCRPAASAATRNQNCLPTVTQLP